MPLVGPFRHLLGRFPPTFPGRVRDLFDTSWICVQDFIFYTQNTTISSGNSKQYKEQQLSAVCLFVSLSCLSGPYLSEPFWQATYDTKRHQSLVGRCTLLRWLWRCIISDMEIWMGEGTCEVCTWRVCLFVCLYVCLSLSLSLFIYLSVCLSVWLAGWLAGWLAAWLPGYIYIYINTLTHVHLYIHIYIYIYTHVCTYKYSCI